jgi:FKBP-type peptidyl-prolyl cis-trans isomerase 2
MNIKVNYLNAVSILILMSGCLQETESEIDRVIERDNAALERYIDTNNIEATKVQSGFYYKKIQAIPEAPQFQNNDFIGIYFEIKTLDGQLVKSYLDETKEPIIFKQSIDLIWPSVFGYAAGLSRLGEELMVYAPSYLAFGNYGYQQLILPNSNLVMRIKFAQKYTEAEMKAREEKMILDHISEKELEGFVKVQDGIYRRILVEGGSEEKVTKNADNVTFDFKLYHMGETTATLESTATNRPTVTLGRQENLRFLEHGLKDIRRGSKVEVLAYSFAAYAQSIQIIPSDIRKDLYQKGEQIDIVKPFTPILFAAEILNVL